MPSYSVLASKITVHLFEENVNKMISRLFFCGNDV